MNAGSARQNTSLDDPRNCETRCHLQDSYQSVKQTTYLSLVDSSTRHFTEENLTERKMLSIKKARTAQNNYWLSQFLGHDVTAFDVISSTGSVEDVLQFIYFLFETDRVETFLLDIILDVWEFFPEAARDLLRLFQQYQCWQQLFLLMQRCRKNESIFSSLSEGAYKIFIDQWSRDLRTLSMKNQSPSNLAIWLPRPRSKVDRFLDFTHNFVRLAYPKAHRTPHSWELYKRHVKKLRAAVKKGSSYTVLRQVAGLPPSDGQLDSPLEVVSRGCMPPISAAEACPTIRTDIVFVPAFSCADMAKARTLHLPLEGRVDEFLQHDTCFLQASKQFLNGSIRRWDSHSTERVLYIHQGEVGNCTPTQADVIMSDRATTCHILSIQSRTCSSKAAPTLVTLTHLDGDIYTDCIIEIIRRHLHHHTTKTRSQDKLILVVDVVGGFDDARGSSIKISFWLMHLLAFVAERFRDRITITLRTCAISCLNDNGLQSPLGRGMGIDMKTGDVFLASADLTITPAMQLRNARIWAGGGGGRLAMVHSHSSDRLIIQPFEFGVFDELHKYLNMPDSKMICHTSTSPDVEEGDFCASVRKTLRFMKAVDFCRVFGPTLTRPLSFERVGLSNVWRC